MRLVQKAAIKRESLAELLRAILHENGTWLSALSCKIARNFDLTTKVSQRIDLVTKDSNWWGHLSGPIVTLPRKSIYPSNQ